MRSGFCGSSLIDRINRQGSFGLVTPKGYTIHSTVFRALRLQYPTAPSRHTHNQIPSPPSVPSRSRDGKPLRELSLDSGGRHCLISVKCQPVLTTPLTSNGSDLQACVIRLALYLRWQRSCVRSSPRQAGRVPDQKRDWLQIASAPIACAKPAQAVHRRAWSSDVKHANAVELRSCIRSSTLLHTHPGRRRTRPAMRICSESYCEHHLVPDRYH